MDNEIDNNRNEEIDNQQLDFNTRDYRPRRRRRQRDFIPPGQRRPTDFREPDRRPPINYFPPQGGAGGGNMPPGPPPNQIPRSRGGQYSTFAIDPGAISTCRYRFVYIWLDNGRSFWAWLVFVGRQSVAGYRWTGFRWEYFGIDTDRITEFICY